MTKKGNAPASNVTTKSNSKNLNYNKIINFYIDEEAIPVRTYLTDEQWADTGMCSDVEIKRVNSAANARAHEEQQKMKDKETRLMWSEGISRPIPRNEMSVNAKIAQKTHAANRHIKTLDGVLAPKSTIEKVNPTTSVIKEPNRPEVQVRNSNIAKLGTKSERDTDLLHYADKRPPKISEKTLEQKILNHKKNLLRKDLGKRKIKRCIKQSDVISSAQSCIFSTSNEAKILKIGIPKRNPKHEAAFQKRRDLTQLLHFSLIQTIAPPNASSSGQSAPQTTPILRKEKHFIQSSDTSDSKTPSVRRNK